MLKTFVGFKGKIAFGEVDKVRFVLLAKTPKDLAALWKHFMPDAPPLDPAGIKSAITIESNLLPDLKTPKENP